MRVSLYHIALPTSPAPLGPVIFACAIAPHTFSATPLTYIVTLLSGCWFVDGTFRTWHRRPGNRGSRSGIATRQTPRLDADLQTSTNIHCTLQTVRYPARQRNRTRAVASLPTTLVALIYHLAFINCLRHHLALTCRGSTTALAPHARLHHYLLTHRYPLHGLSFVDRPANNVVRRGRLPLPRTRGARTVWFRFHAGLHPTSDRTATRYSHSPHAVPTPFRRS